MDGKHLKVYLKHRIKALKGDTLVSFSESFCNERIVEELEKVLELIETLDGAGA